MSEECARCIFDDDEVVVQEDYCCLFSIKRKCQKSRWLKTSVVVVDRRDTQGNLVFSFTNKAILRSRIAKRKLR